jgi:hypothetical protein
MDPPPFFDPLLFRLEFELEHKIQMIPGHIDPAEFEYGRIFII